MKTALFALGLIFSASLLFNACGVKGMPQPPTTAPILGRGEPNYSKATENVKIKKNTNKANDWEDSPDFSEDKEK
jgi:hypothetical protein